MKNVLNLIFGVQIVSGLKSSEVSLGLIDKKEHVIPIKYKIQMFLPNAYFY